MIAGEPSGDLHASNLVLELKRLSPGLEISGTGGEKMQRAGVKLIFGLRDLAVTGLFDVIKNLSKLKKIQQKLLETIQTERIDLIILVDYPDFNLRFAKKAARYGVPIIYYISPQVWAWRKHRIKLIKKYVKKIFVIFKFEEELYRHEGIDVEFIGHPLLDIVKPSHTRSEFFKTPLPRGEWPSAENRIVALMPGSRKGLVKRHLPIMLEAASIVHKRFPDVYFLISKTPALSVALYREAIEATGLPITVVEDNAYNIINASDIVLAISGTVTLETAILEKPMVIIYKLPLLEYIIAKPLLRLRNIGLVNIVAGREIVPELIQSRATPKIIAENLIDILTDKQKYGRIVNDLAVVRSDLYPSGASKNAAISILKILG